MDVKQSRKQNTENSGGVGCWCWCWCRSRQHDVEVRAGPSVWYASVLVCLTRRRTGDEGSKESEHGSFFFSRSAAHSSPALSARRSRPSRAGRRRRVRGAERNMHRGTLPTNSGREKFGRSKPLVQARNFWIRVEDKLETRSKSFFFVHPSKRTEASGRWPCFQPARVAARDMVCRSVLCCSPTIISFEPLSDLGLPVL